jgi:hypothetical protein
MRFYTSHETAQFKVKDGLKEKKTLEIKDERTKEFYKLLREGKNLEVRFFPFRVPTRVLDNPRRMSLTVREDIR